MGALFRYPGFTPFIAVAFINAFVDLGHKILIQNTLFKTLDGSTQIALTSVVNGLILLPFVLLFTPAGWLSDKWPKDQVMRWSAAAAVGLTLLITGCYYLGWFWPAFCLTFALAAQSALYSPAKFGYLKELVDSDRLAAGNAVLQAVGTAAILAGIFAFSVLFEALVAPLEGSGASSATYLQTFAPLGWLLVALSAVEWALTHRLPKHNTGDPTLSFDWIRYWRGGYTRENLRFTRQSPVVWQCILGLAVFWSIAQVTVAAFPALAKVVLDETNTVVIQGIMASSGIGIVVGSAIAGRLSRDHIETGLIPVGAVGVALGVSLLTVIQQPLAMALLFAVLGICGGLLLAPLNALIQFNAGQRHLARVLAGSNLVQNAIMLGFLLVTAVAGALGLDGAPLFALMALVAWLGVGLAVVRLPFSLSRFILSSILGHRYRLKIIGLEHMPEEGGVLLLGNHVSWIDWAVIQIASPRPVRFVMLRAIYKRWYWRRFLDWAGVVPINPGASRQSLATVTELLNDGQVVCLFPEGSLSRNGQMATFRRGFERAAAGAKGVIVPFYIHGLWGSRFSMAPRQKRPGAAAGPIRRVVVAFGPSLPMSSRADEVRQRVQALSVTSWRTYAAGFDTLDRAWIKTAVRRGGAAGATDGVLPPRSARQLLVGSLLMARKIKATPGERTGILLPASVGAALANISTLMAGKVAVNFNYTLAPATLGAQAERAEVTTLLTSRRFLNALEERNLVPTTLLEACEVHYLEDWRESFSARDKLLALLTTLVVPGSWLAAWVCHRRSPDTPAAILFSSGSEGIPKGVVLSHRNIMANIRQVGDLVDVQGGDAIIGSLPPFHAFGLTVTVMLPFIEGLFAIYHPDPTDAVGIAKAVEKHQATILLGTSTFLRLYTKNRRVTTEQLASLRLVLAGAEKLAPDVVRAFKEKFGQEVLEGYGTTETAPVACVNLPDVVDPRFDHIQRAAKPGTVGLPLPGTAVRIIDPDSLAELPTGEAGLVAIGGPQVMMGYLDDPERTEAAFVTLDGERYYRTGDKGSLDDDGFLTIVDRYSRFAKIGGEMVSLGAVEVAVREVLAEPELELAAVALPDPKKGERIVLLVAKDEDGQQRDPDALRTTLIKHCSPLMVPAMVAMVDHIPKLASGKTDFAATKHLARQRSEAA